MGQLGMSLEDFLDISPFEFSEIHASWLELQEHREHNEWDRARWSIFKTLCPPDKKSITIYDIQDFEWDPQQKKAPISTRERFDELTQKYGKRLQAGNRDSSKRQEL